MSMIISMEPGPHWQGKIWKGTSQILLNLVKTGRLYFYLRYKNEDADHSTLLRIGPEITCVSDDVEIDISAVPDEVFHKMECLQIHLDDN